MSAAFLTRTYVLVVLLVFLALAVGTYATAEQAYLTTTPAAANQTQQQINTIRQSATPESIFENNFLVSIPAIVPAAGLFFFGLTWFNTGQSIGQLAYYTGIPPSVYVLGVYIPVGTVESLAYSVIIAETLFLTYALIKGTIVARLKSETWKSLILYVVLLAVAATVEALLIKG